MSCLVMPQHKNPCLLGHQIYNFDGPFLGHYYYILSLSFCAWEQRKRFLNLYFRGNETKRFGKPFFGDYNFALSLSLSFPRVQKMILIEILQIHYMTYMATPQNKNPNPEGHKLYNFGRPFLCHNYYTHVLHSSDPCPSVDKKRGEIFHFYYMAMSQSKTLPRGS